jgi:hypothetical protein
MNRLRERFPSLAAAALGALGALAVAGCGDDATFDPAPSEDVTITVVGEVVSSAGQVPVSDASVWVDVETPEGADTRGSTRSDEAGRFALQFRQPDCGLATERAFRVFARKKGFSDAALTDDGNGGQPVLRCTSREQVVNLELGTP